jgi:hypothetical protein
MRNFIAYSVMIVPLLGYNIYCFMTREPETFKFKINRFNILLLSVLFSSCINPFKIVHQDGKISDEIENYIAENFHQGKLFFIIKSSMDGEKILIKSNNIGVEDVLFNKVIESSVGENIVEIVKVDNMGSYLLFKINDISYEIPIGKFYDYRFVTVERSQKNKKKFILTFYK